MKRLFTSNIFLLTFAVTIATVNLIPFLGLADVYQVSEGREGVVVNSILQTHEYILPLRQAELIPSKPPLFHWLSVGVAKAFGVYSNFELRFISALAAILLIAQLALFLLSNFNARLALVSTLVLASTDGFLRMGSDGRVDMLLTFFISSALLVWLSAFLRAGTVSGISDRSYRSMRILLALAVLTKGPIGLVLPLLVLLAFVALKEGWTGLRALVRKDWLWVLLLSAPWYVAATVLGRQAFLGRQVFFENISRFTGGEGITKKPFWFYLAEFWPHALPWSVPFLLLVIMLLFSRKRRTAGSPESVPLAEPASQVLTTFCLVWLLTLVGFYSLSSGKRAAYLLTVLPPFAVLFGLVIDAFWNQGEEWIFANAERMEKFRRSGFAVLLILLGLSALVFVFPYLPEKIQNRSTEFHALTEFLQRYPFAFAGLSALLPLAATIFWLQGLKRRRLSYLVCALWLLAECAVVVYANIGEAVKGMTHGYRQFALEVAGEVSQADRLTFIKKKRDESFDGFFFYFPRVVYLFEPVDTSEASLRPATAGWYLARNEWINEQPDSWTARVERKLIGGRRVDEEGRKVVLFYLREEEANASTATATSN